MHSLWLISWQIGFRGILESKIVRLYCSMPITASWFESFLFQANLSKGIELLVSYKTVECSKFLKISIFLTNYLISNKRHYPSAPTVAKTFLSGEKLIS
jgi:hypothetical protein